MADLVVYGTPLSPFVRKVEGVLGHVGSAYELEPVSVMAMPDWFLAISPARRIPVLRDRTIGPDGAAGTIADSSAICLFLDRRHNAGLYGDTAFEAGRVAAMEEYADTVLAQTAGLGLFRPIMFPRFAGKGSDLETARTTWKEKLPPILDYLEGELAGRQHFVGDRLSIADFAVATHMMQIDLVAGLPDPNRWPGLVTHAEAMKLRPGIAGNLEQSAKMLSRALPDRVDLRS